MRDDLSRKIIGLAGQIKSLTTGTAEASEKFYLACQRRDDDVLKRLHALADALGYRLVPKD